MRATVLVDDISSNTCVEAEHGLSLYLESRGKRFLFDVGLSDLFTRNAVTLNCDIESVDKLILSHGHCDHTGGLSAFLALNSKAKVYITPTTFRAYFSFRENGRFQNIGTERFDLIHDHCERFEINNGVMDIGEGLTLFSDVENNVLFSEANRNLYVWDDNDGSEVLCRVGEYVAPCARIVHDRFLHEQNLIVTTERGKHILFVGCSHRGIVNILDRCENLLGVWPDVVVGGFHLMIPSRNEIVSCEQLDSIARALALRPCKYLTGHCVSLEAFERVRVTLGERIALFRAGDVLEF